MYPKSHILILLLTHNPINPGLNENPPKQNLLNFILDSKSQTFTKTKNSNQGPKTS